MALTVCPLSNYKLQVVDDMQDHPLKSMLDRGLKATVNSDDPAYFGGYMTENFQAVSEALPLTETDLIKISRNAVEASFASDSRKQELRQEIDRFEEAWSGAA